MTIEYISYFCMLLQDIAANGLSVGSKVFLPLIAMLSVGLVYVALYVLKAIAVCTMARKRSIKWWWVGMLPYANFVLLGKLCGPVRIFRVDVKNIGAWVMSAMIVTDVISVTTNVYFFVKIYEILAEYQPIASDVTQEINERIAQLYSGNIFYLIYWFNYVLKLVYLVSYFSLCVAIFGKYAPDKRMLFAVLSLIQPLFSVFLFVVRNNKPFSGYDEFLKQKMAEKFGQSYDPFSNPYETKENPFFTDDKNDKNDGSQDDSPFDEF